MRRWTLPRVSPSMVVASIALTVALTGTGIAAVTQLAPNSVGTAQLKNRAVTSAKLRAQSVDNAKIRSNTITSSRIRNGTLLRADFRPGQIPDDGASTPSFGGLQRVDAVTGLSSVTSKSVSVNCPTGKRVVGGGARVTGSGAGRVSIVENFPDSDGVKWNARAAEVVGISATWELQAYALCATVAS